MIIPHNHTRNLFGAVNVAMMSAIPNKQATQFTPSMGTVACPSLSLLRACERRRSDGVAVGSSSATLTEPRCIGLDTGQDIADAAAAF